MAQTVDDAERVAVAAPHADWRKGALLGAAVGASTLGLALVNPRDSGMPVCWSAGFFGIDCPLCGGLRCVNSLARGDWLTAADHNVLLAVALPVVVAGWVLWMVAAVKRRPFTLPRAGNWAWVLAVGTVAAFTVLRNLDLGPVAHWLAATSG